MKKILVLTDIHSNYYLLQKIYDEVKDLDIDEYIICGDMITDGFDNNKVLDDLRAKNAHMIAGNRELSMANYDVNRNKELKQYNSFVYCYNELTSDNKEFLKSLPIYKIVVIEGVKICIAHGSPYNVRDIIIGLDEDLFDKLIADFDADVYLFGHTHISFNLTYKKRLFINSGAVSLTSEKKAHASYGILTISDKKISYEAKSYEYNFDEVKNYYLNSDYYHSCFVWCNLLLGILKTGEDYCSLFIKYINKFAQGDKKLINELWEDKFQEFMNNNKLEIIEKNDYN